MASRRHCWCAVYFLLSVTLGIIAISSALHSTSKNLPPKSPTAPTFPNSLSINAAAALRKAGFTFTADLLNRHPPFFLPPNNSTFFAIKDSSINNSTNPLPLWFLKTLLRYHTVTSKPYSFHNLLQNPSGTCFSTLFRQKNISLTNVNRSKKLIEINHVLISHPDIFLGENIAIHGVLAPFASLDPRNFQTWDFIQSATCRSFNSSSTKNDAVNWNGIVRSLSSKGYASFSIALHSVLDAISREGLGSVTIFAPPDLTFLLGYPSTLLNRAVRIHILPQRLSHKELKSLPVRSLLKTLITDVDLEIDGILNFMPGLLINGVQVVAPDLLVSEKFVVHGISKAFKMDELTA